MFRKILVPTDGSELSGSAVAASLKLAEENGASIVALNIQPTYRPPIVAEVPVAWVDAPGSKVDAAKEIRRFLRDLLKIKWNDLRGVYA